MKLATKQNIIALNIASFAFNKKKDLSGRPYMEHLLRVSDNFADSEVKETVALLHDLLEDCPEWKESHLSHIFDTQIVDAIVAITKIKNEDYETYIERVSKNSIAKAVKIEDLKDNMNITRLNKLSESDLKRIQKYHKAYKYLTNN